MQQSSRIVLVLKLGVLVLERGVLLGSFVLLLLLRSPILAQAQATPDLVITLRTAVGAGIAGATITVHDRDDTDILAQVQTDANGTATLSTVLMSDVRVAVAGHLADGTPLQQLATDTGGIALFLDGARTTRLDLRVEADGTVIPDPQTMLVLEAVPTVAASVYGAVAAAIQPTATGAAAAVGPTVPLMRMVTPVAAGTLAPTLLPGSVSPATLVVIVLLSLVVVAVVAQLGVRLWRERRSQ